MKSGTSCAKANICLSPLSPPTFPYLPRKSEYEFGSFQGRYGLCCQGLEHTRGSAASQPCPSLRYTPGILVLCFLILVILALLTWITGLAVDLFCHCVIVWPSWGCCPKMSPLIGPSLSYLLRYCWAAALLEWTSVLPASLSPLAPAYVLSHGAVQSCCSLLLVVFLFIRVSLFIIII